MFYQLIIFIISAGAILLLGYVVFRVLVRRDYLARGRSSLLMITLLSQPPDINRGNYISFSQVQCAPGVTFHSISDKLEFKSYGKIMQYG